MSITLDKYLDTTLSCAIMVYECTPKWTYSKILTKNNQVYIQGKNPTSTLSKFGISTLSHTFIDKNIKLVDGIPENYTDAE